MLKLLSLIGFKQISCTITLSTAVPRYFAILGRWLKIFHASVMVSLSGISADKGPYYKDG